MTRHVVAVLISYMLTVLGAGGALAQVADTVIRGENVRLRTEPDRTADVVAVLQRAESIRVTGEAAQPDGSTRPVTADTLGFAYNVLVPVEVVATGDVGWISEVFVDPRGFVVGAAPEPTAAARAQDAPTGGIDAETRERARRKREQGDPSGWTFREVAIEREGEFVVGRAVFINNADAPATTPTTMALTDGAETYLMVGVMDASGEPKVGFAGAATLPRVPAGRSLSMQLLYRVPANVPVESLRLVWRG